MALLAAKLISMRLSKSVIGIIALVSSFQLFAAEWRVAPIQIGDRYGQESRYFYINKGEQWQDAVYITDFQTTGNALLTVSLNGKTLQSRHLSRSGNLQIKLPVLQKSGFHRLDFSFRQEDSFASLQPSKDQCEEYTSSLTNLGAGKIFYTSIRPKGFQIRNLPDALFNPHIQDAPAFVGRMRFDTKKDIELTAMGRLASAWPAASRVHWVDHTLPEASSADFTIELRAAPELPKGGFVSLSEGGKSKSHPYLLILYKDAAALESSIHALLNNNYLAQIHGNKVSIPSTIEAPNWGKIKEIKTLADLGIENFRLDSSSRSMPLVFPGAWQPTDLLQGKISLSAQSGLLQGSKVTVWLNDALAGSMRLDELQSESVVREIQYVEKNLTENTNFDLRLESTLFANLGCLPSSKGSLWVDSQKSLVNLPHRLKSGVAGVSPALIPHPRISIDGSPGSTGMAISLLQVASKMLLSNEKVPAVLTYKEDKDAVVRIRTDEKLYQQRIALHEDKIFGPYATAGVLIISEDDRFEIIAQNLASTVLFMYRWPRIQAVLPDGASEILLAQDGDIVVLDRYVSSTKNSPQVKQSTVTLMIALMLLIMTIGTIWWFWRANRKNA